MLPTAPTIYTIAEVLADPIEPNSRLGTYTNFVNLLDLCGVRCAGAAMRADGMPFGVTLLAPAREDAALAAIGRRFHDASGLPLGALNSRRSALTCAATTRQPSGKAHPGLHLAADLAGRGVAVEQRGGDREVAAVGGDHGARRCVRARPTGERAARNAAISSWP